MLIQKQIYTCIILCILLFSSCDNIYKVNIENKSFDKVYLTIYYDKNILDSIYKNDSKTYNSYLLDFSKNQKSVYYSYDSVSTTSNFVILKNNYVLIEDGMNTSPHYTLIKMIEMKKGNEHIIYPKKSLDTLFKKKKDGLWVLELK